MIVGSIFGIIITSPVLGPIRTLAGGINAAFIWGLGYLCTGMSLALLPIVKPNIYESIKTGRVPLPRICGIVAFALGLLFFAVNAASLQILDITITSIALGIGLCLYSYYAYKNEKMGVALKALLSEIPPE